MDPPTAEQCSTGEIVEIGERRGVALWWPQMGGYAGRAVVFTDSDCSEILVWHDGEFPFDGRWCDNCDQERRPARIHLCDPQHWIRLGQNLELALQKLAPPEAWSAGDPPE